MEIRKRKTKVSDHSEKDDHSVDDETIIDQERYISTDTWFRLFGFDPFESFSSINSLKRLLCRPEHPSLLAFSRIVFGLMMLLDFMKERNFPYLDYMNEEDCIFPLIHNMPILTPEYLAIIGLIMLLSINLFITSLFYKIPIILYAAGYWYMFLMEKCNWNNHSYLYGLICILFIVCDGSSAYTFHNLFNRIFFGEKEKNVRHVPLWNYAVLRLQIFLVYFYAGVKKLDSDWLGGMSMMRLSSHWIFSPFTLILTEQQITDYIIHWGGWSIDFFGGFLVFFDLTRPVGTTIFLSFHFMNSRLFHIGMFPYTMIATLPLFFYPDCIDRCARSLANYLDNRDYFEHVAHFINNYIVINKIDGVSEECIYQTKDEIDKCQKLKSYSANYVDRCHPDEEINEKINSKQEKQSSPNKSSWKLKFLTVYVFLQIFLPFSHFVTRGYNGWTEGLYGYSWDMMVHTWSVQHSRIKVVDMVKNETLYINPKQWTDRRRWNSHPDMIKQYANCLKRNLKRRYGILHPEIYIDVWRSLNHRFNQRYIDPRVNILEMDWNPFTPTPWLLPLLTDLSNWRSRLNDMEQELFTNDDYAEVTFVADFPGLTLENFVTHDINASIEVLSGEITVEIKSTGKNFTLKSKSLNKQNITESLKIWQAVTENQMVVPSNAYHHVHVTGTKPACYMYIFKNETLRLEQKFFQNYVKTVRPIFEKQFNHYGPIVQSIYNESMTMPDILSFTQFGKEFMNFYIFFAKRFRITEKNTYDKNLQKRLRNFMKDETRQKVMNNTFYSELPSLYKKYIASHILNETVKAINKLNINVSTMLNLTESDIHRYELTKKKMTKKEIIEMLKEASNSEEAKKSKEALRAVGTTLHRIQTQFDNNSMFSQNEFSWTPFSQWLIKLSWQYEKFKGRVPHETRFDRLSFEVFNRIRYQTKKKRINFLQEMWEGTINDYFKHDGLHKAFINNINITDNITPKENSTKSWIKKLEWERIQRKFVELFSSSGKAIYQFFAKHMYKYYRIFVIIGHDVIALKNGEKLSKIMLPFQEAEVRNNIRLMYNPFNFTSVDYLFDWFNIPLFVDNK
ncbi:hypothetical protein SNEBB_000019 [Seison nebaliae]|nr:hypothetical protein SNEBB_000019 [Seison nebaliae]